MVDTTAPSVPTLESAKAKSPTSVELTWLGSYDAVGVTAYKVYQDTVLVYTSGVSTGYTVSGLTPGTEYDFYIKATDAAANDSEASNVLTVTTPAESDTATTASTSAPAAGAGRAQIDFGATPVSTGTFVVLDPQVTPTSRIVAQIAYESPVGRDLDETEMDDILLRCQAGAGQFTIFAHATDGSYLEGEFFVNYTLR